MPFVFRLLSALLRYGRSQQLFDVVGEVVGVFADGADQILVEGHVNSRLGGVGIVETLPVPIGMGSSSRWAWMRIVMRIVPAGKFLPGQQQPASNSAFWATGAHASSFDRTRALDQEK